MTPVLRKEDILKLAQIIREETGNDVQEKNYSMIESRMRNHLMKIGIASPEDYWKHFTENEKEERELLQSLMTTHYTFFFREYAHFEALQKWIDTESARIKERYEKTKMPMRIWSAACSRGQEVYSLAMYLEVNLVKKLNIPYEIIGTDIDPESVAHAKNGVYALKEVNTIPQMYLSAYWKKGTGPIKDFAAIQTAVKNKLRFEALNLLEIEKWQEKNKFDIIFCRNVFIYFSQENVRKIALSLVSRMDDKGLFVSGMSEPLRFDGWALESVGPSCYQKMTQASQQQPQKKISIAPTTQESTKATVKPVVSASQSPKKYRVLCVDDSPTIQILIKKIFSQDALCEKVDTAINGKEAREKLNAQNYDLITLDIHMPEVSGIEFLENLYDRKKDPPVLMVSSVNRTDLELATRSMTLGAFDYVEKPAMNNLQKSSDELLTKAKMALRSGDRSASQTEVEFDASIGKKIVVPDASQCMRIVMASDTAKDKLMHIVKGQKGEYRSPALLIVWQNSSGNSSIENELMNWSDRPIVPVRGGGKTVFKPNTIYVVNYEISQQILPQMNVKSASVQILGKELLKKDSLAKTTHVQLLLDEALADFAKNIESQSGLKISDITPVTSFPSLSLEFFANLRKAAA